MSEELLILFCILSIPLLALIVGSLVVMILKADQFELDERGNACSASLALTSTMIRSGVEESFIDPSTSASWGVAEECLLSWQNLPVNSKIS